MEQALLNIIKIGGNIIDDEQQLHLFLTNFASIPGNKILVHGGGIMATRVAEQIGISQQMIEGRRITDTETLKIITMVYAGYINKHMVVKLQQAGCNALGLCGADGNSILSHQRIHPSLDFGWVGDVDEVNAPFFIRLLQQGLYPVVAPLTHNGEGQLLNTNADTIAQELAKALSKEYRVQLIYIFEKNGVLLDAGDDSTVIRSINPSQYKKLKQQHQVFAGMIPKLDNAFSAISHGVSKVRIGKAEDIHQLLNGERGTGIIYE